MDPTIKNVLLTGTPGCGKTTVILSLADKLRDLRLAGFHTQELREWGQRVGFEAVGLSSGLRCVLAHQVTVPRPRRSLRRGARAPGPAGAGRAGQAGR